MLIQIFIYSITLKYVNRNAQNIFIKFNNEPFISNCSVEFVLLEIFQILQISRNRTVLLGIFQKSTYLSKLNFHFHHEELM